MFLDRLSSNRPYRAFYVKHSCYVKHSAGESKVGGLSNNYRRFAFVKGAKGSSGRDGDFSVVENGFRATMKAGK